MKQFSKNLLIGLLAGQCFFIASTHADLEVSTSVQIRATTDFSAPLTPYGTWIDVGAYGPCWRPAGIAVGWRPYSYGSWVWTDCGWYWVSDEPWAWACYHYGSWVYEPNYGWFWVPGIEWAPAWVSWRFGGGYCGWAPLAPRGLAVPARSFVFVEAAHFNNPVRPSSVIVNDVTILNKTKEVGGIKRETRSFAAAPSQKVVVNEGPGVDAIRKSTGKTVGVVSIQEAVRQTPVPSNALGKLNESRRKDGRPDPQSSAGVTTPGSGKVGGSDAETQYPGAQKSHPDKPGKPGKGKKKDGGKGKD